MANKRDGIKEILESGRAPGAIIRGAPYEYKSKMPNMAEGMRSADAQERAEARHIAEMRRRVQQHERENKGRHRKQGSMRHIGRVPRAAYEALKRSEGSKTAWLEDPKRMLKRTGFNLVDDL